MLNLITCWDRFTHTLEAIHADNITYRESNVIIITTFIVLSHTLTIDGSPNPHLAGETLIVTCTACSEFLPSLQWIDSQNDTIENIGTPVLEGENCTSLSLIFNSLKTSQGGRYTCLSVVDIPFSERKITRDVIVKSK